MKFISHSLTETITLGKMLGRTLLPGDVVLSSGDLGAGKTAFCKGVAKGVGVRETVNSPTFNIIKVYNTKGNLSFNHIDAYRLEDEMSIKEIGLDEVLGDESGYSYVEWGEFINDYLVRLKGNIIIVEISYISKTKRLIEVKRKYE